MDREKVIKGLECHGKGGSQGCRGCPYELTHGCQLILCHDALALIKEQETVVRCKDCEYADGCENGIVTCGKEIGTFCCIEHSENWYCANGVRKE